MSVNVKVAPGDLPEFWNESVVFFANILSLFYGNTTETAVLKQEVGALETYGSRLLPLINIMFRGRDNLLILESPPDQDLIAYFKSDLKLSLPTFKIVKQDIYESFEGQSEALPSKAQFLIDELVEHPARLIDGYVVDASLLRIGSLTGKKILGTPTGSRNGNDKLVLHEFLQITGLKIYDSFFVQGCNGIADALKALKSKGYVYAVIKAPIGASGVGMCKVSVDEVAIQSVIPEYLLYEGQLLIQGWLDETVKGVTNIGSPSVQLFVDNECVTLYDLTDQILSAESIHEGNVAPPAFLMGESACRDEIFKQARVAGAWLHDQGYRGTGSIDFQVIRRDDGLEVRICEINARVTGATYPAILARTFNGRGAWLMRNIRFDPRHDTSNLLQTIDAAGLLYRPGMEQGILPFNFNPNPQGRSVKGQFLFLAPTVEQTLSLLKKMQELDSIEGVYDRD